MTLLTEAPLTAAERNRAYADTLGWGARLAEVRRALNPRRTAWDDAALVTETSKWQARTGLAADGVLGPTTWAYLRVAAGLDPDPAISAQLPAQGPGFYADGPRERHFARPETVRALLATALGWHDARPGGPRIGFREISVRGGGPVTGHGSHRLGLDVDIRPVRADGKEAPALWNQPGYSQSLTQELVDRLHGNGVLPVHFILFNDPHVRGVRKWDGHDNHLHVRFRPPVPARPSAAVPPASGVRATDALGTLVAPGSAPPYRFTPDDLLWTARFLVGETGGSRAGAEQAAVVWAMLNRYGLLTRSRYPSFHAFLRAYSTPLQPVLRNWRATRRAARQDDFVPIGGMFGPPAPPGVQMGQRQRYIALQRLPWERLPAAARSVAVRALTGGLANPVGNATEFGSTRVYFHDRYGRYPGQEEWQRFTERFAAGRRWTWIGPVPGLDQLGNTFFVQNRLAGLAPRAVRVLPP
ncbi:penicillin-insensitive murein endopeptidase [Streptomyces sp. NPDC001928]|uniref:penicillin-insensitive murein endopeptidase n=1 Tax=Streptomyces sp. NPDC001928 TaxID=3154404 RepID=UPI0033243DE2